jgi:G:T-mismatch repair DNA endonuclease (very short patch repair protein)
MQQCPHCFKRFIRLGVHLKNLQRVYLKETVSCYACAKIFEVNPSFKKGQTNFYCSNLCRQTKNPQIVCYTCGKLFHRTRSQVKKYKTHFCSKKCNKNGKEIKCTGCGQLGYRALYQIKSLKNYFCKICVQEGKSMEHMRSFIQTNNTSLEKQILTYINQHKLPFKYVGNNKFYIKGFNPDFIHTNKKIAVEAYGCYWHGCSVCGFTETDQTRGIHHRDTKKLQILNKEGWQLLVIWEHDLPHLDNIFAKIYEHI